MAANFMGWYLATVTALESPVMLVSTMPITPTHAPTLRLRWQCATLRLRSSIQPHTPTTNTPPSVHALSTVWKNLLIAIGEQATAQKLVISLRIVAGLNSQPVGYCIQALATKIHSADSVAPMAVSHVEARWKRGLTFFQPKNITAMNVDSIKKARMPSMASGAPKMSPTNQL